MRDLEDTILEITCPDCGSEYELSYDEEENEEPIYCPFCGTDLPDSAVEESTENEDEFGNYIDMEEDDEDDENQ